jgi:hypothetical protein
MPITTVVTVWVLMMYMPNVKDASGFVQEFATKSACETAKAEYYKLSSGWGKGICVPKDDTGLLSVDPVPPNKAY